MAGRPVGGFGALGTRVMGSGCEFHDWGFGRRVTGVSVEFFGSRGLGFGLWGEE